MNPRTRAFLTIAAFFFMVLALEVEMIYIARRADRLTPLTWDPWFLIVPPAICFTCAYSMLVNWTIKLQEELNELKGKLNG